MTPDRLNLEAAAESALKDWLVARAYELAYGDMGKAHDLLTLEKASRTPWKPWNVFDQGERYAKLGNGAYPTIRAGEDVFQEILVKARDLGAKEAASALLRDPPRKYRDYTRRELRILARQQVSLVDGTTRRMLGNVSRLGKPEDVDALLQKSYSLSRCQGIALDQVSKGYIRGAAEVLRENGYRYVYARTMEDERVCKFCSPWDSQPFTLLRFIELYPRHPKCRCYPSSTREDGTRDPELHAKSLLVAWEQSIVARTLAIR